MLPSSHSHRGVEDIGHKERDTEGDVGLDQIQNLNFREKEKLPLTATGMSPFPHFW